MLTAVLAAITTGLGLARALLLATPGGTRQFWLIVGTLAALLVTHLIFWVMT